MTGPRALAIVLGRAGSKGVPGKNLAPIAGKPCVRWTIDAARASKSVGDVAVSSDSDALLTLARDAGAIAIARPPELAHDAARVDDAARDALTRYESAHAPLAPTAPIVVLYANVPVRPLDLIDRAVALLVSTGCDSVQSYTTVGKHHPWWMIRLDDAGRIAPWQGDVLYHNVFRRQDLPPAFVPDGGVLVVTRRALTMQIPGVPDGPHAFLGIDRRGVTTPEGGVVDIDTPSDLLEADALLRRSS